MKQNIPSFNNLESVFFINDAKGWAVGELGTIITYDGPVTFESSNSKVPIEYSLSQNYPNPFNPSTTIEYSIPERTNVKLTVINIVGEEVTTLVNRTMDAGNYSVEFSAKGGLPSGVYFYSLQAGNFMTSKKMVLLK